LSFVTRFAPSPTGPLHLGHAYSAILAHDMARAEGGRFLLRIEDIDRSRSRPEWEELIFEDLGWLGVSWDGPVMRQSERMGAYAEALEVLAGMGLIYACTCRRTDIQAALSAPQEGVAIGPDGVVYPGTCRTRRVARLEDAPEGAALRLDMAAALDGPVAFRESGAGPAGESGAITVSPERMVAGIGDVVLARREMGTSYHMSVVVDDAAQGVSHVVRGQDLFEATAIHVLLQRLLGLRTPVYHDHWLIRDEAGKRLAKRDDARAIRTYREAGVAPGEIRAMVGL